MTFLRLLLPCSSLTISLERPSPLFKVLLWRAVNVESRKEVSCFQNPTNPLSGGVTCYSLTSAFEFTSSLNYKGINS